MRDPEVDSDWYERFGDYVAERREGTFAPFTGSIEAGTPGGELIRAAARILIPDPPQDGSGMGISCLG